MNILRNKAIAEAYNSIYEKTNIDGTIDDISRHDEILHIASKELLNIFIDRLVDFLSFTSDFDFQPAELLERSVTYDNAAQTRIKLPSKISVEDKAFEVTLPDYYYFNKSDERETRLNFRELYKELKYLKQNLLDKNDIYDYSMEQIYKQLKLPIGMIKLKYISDKLVGILEKTILFVTTRGIVVRVMTGFRFKITSINPKAYLGKSISFRKKLSSPKFPDKEIDKEIDKE